MPCQCYGCPMNCKDMHMHRSIYWKMEKYYKEKNKENYIPSKVRRLMSDEDEMEDTKISKKPSSKINYEKLKEYQNTN